MKLTQSMIDATIREIEEPLITCYELAEETCDSVQLIQKAAHNNKIIPYKILLNGKIVNAFDKKQALEIIKIRNGMRGAIRKNKLNISEVGDEIDNA